MAFATWRVAPEWVFERGDQGGEWLGFRLCYVVEAGVRRHMAPEWPDGGEDLILANVQRRADSFLPPSLEVLHLDLTFSEVSDQALLAILEQPYSSTPDVEGRRDYNLGSRHQALAAVVDHADFVHLCREARARSEDLLRSSASFTLLVEQAALRARNELGLRNDRLRQRAAAAERESKVADPQIEREIAVNEVIVAAVADPSVRLDSIGFFIVASTPPEVAG
jgi:ATP-dependent helicase HepA